MALLIEGSLKTQNIIDPFLSALYNTYSLSADLTYPYEERTLPQSLKFTIDITYIAEGEEDSCKLEVLIHADMDIVLFCWKKEINQTYSYGIKRQPGPCL